MYSLNTPLETIRGIGPKMAPKLAELGFRELKDLLLFLPLRYSDRSEIVKISNLEEDKLVTFKATLKTLSGFYKNRRRMDTATVEDETGKVKLMWFNNKFIKTSLKVGKTYMISGKLNNRGTVIQPTVEVAKDDTIHTGRLVPIYSSTIDVQQGSLRRILRNATTQLESSTRSGISEFPKSVTKILENSSQPIQLKDAILQLHFPDSEEQIIEARERLALEELLLLIKTSEKIKEHWQNLKSAEAISLSEPQIPKSIPFELTGAQKRSVKEILSDLQLFTPMNRVLIGDVGSGKTVVAGIAAQQVLNCGHSVAFVAPTKILAEQHLETLQKLFPKMELVLLTGKSKLSGEKKSKKSGAGEGLVSGEGSGAGEGLGAGAVSGSTNTPKLYIGTHAVINKLDEIDPALVIYDEQHRFGVKQRSVGGKSIEMGASKKSAGATTATTKIKTPHTLTMSATPIPRSLMLTIFSHLKVSFIDEMPAGRKITKTWIVPEEKRAAGYDWIAKELAEEQAPEKTIKKSVSEASSSKLALVVCPFIDPSNHEAFENVASTKETYEKIKEYFAGGDKSVNAGSDKSVSASGVKSTNTGIRKSTTAKTKLKIGLLHGRMKKGEQDKVIEKLYKNKIDILVTTPIVEVGVDLPTASIIIIETADRFGMASLHQLRGRVGRAGQQGYCLLFSDSKSKLAKKRLKQFSGEHNGLKLAELDLKNRGSGDIFGTTQSGFSQLQFATWTNLELIAQAKLIHQNLPKNWKPFFEVSSDKNEPKPLAN